MKTHFFYVLLLVSLAFLGLSGCKTDEDLMPQQETENVDEPMDKELADYFESLPSKDNLQLSNIILPSGQNVQDFLEENAPDLIGAHKTDGAVDDDAIMEVLGGLGPQKTKEALISLMAQQALYLTDRTEHQYADDGTNAPKQNGLAYVYGSKSIAKRQIGQSSVCQEKLYGLDCSGFVAKVAHAAGIMIPTGNANTQATAITWKNALDAKFKEEVAKVKVEVFENLSWSELQSGDIVGYYKKGTTSVQHIGMVLQTGNTKTLFQADGSPSNVCSKNTDVKHGPVRHEVAGTTYWLTQKYRVVRFTIDIDGKWDLLGRCIDQTYDVLGLELLFPTQSSGQTTFTATGSGVDYDGTTPFDAEFTASYDRLHNVITNAQIQFHFPTHTRIDELPDIPLAGQDETDYIYATCMQNCGCDLKVKLVNKSN